MKVKIASIERNRYEDGPGIRTTVFFQGCNVKCKGCHNEKIQDIQYGKEYEVKKLCEEILKYDLPIKKITISGGEPMMQKEALEEFIDDTKWTHLDIAGTAWASGANPYYSQKGATGQVFRTVFSYLKNSKN